MKPKKIAISQSNYIPWKGYFDMINSVDEFIFYDEMQYTRRDWRNRNKIKTTNGLIWLTVPVDTKGKFHQKINETVVKNQDWREKHWKTIESYYKKSPYFSEYEPVFKALYLDSEETYLSKINYNFIKAINAILQINTKLSWSADYNIEGDKSEKLLNICKQAEATSYTSGPAAKDYMDTSLFADENIAVVWMNYSGYPEYHQNYLPFEHGVTILDLLFNEGPNASKFMKSF